MRFIKCILILALFPLLGQRQPVSNPLRGEWYPVSYQSLVTGSITNLPDTATHIVKVNFQPKGLVEINACHGAGCRYEVRADSLILSDCQCYYRGHFVLIHCKGWEGLLENAFNRGHRRLSFEIDRNRLEIRSENQFIIVMER
jgi:hypothetical protein